jgi:hypothetical protein
MKLVVAAAAAVVAVGLIATGPVAFALLVMVAPLLALMALSGWGVTHRTGRAPIKRHAAPLRGRHVIKPGPSR